MSLKHTDDPVCPSCEAKLSQVDSELTSWFNWLKVNHPTVHLSWGYRDKMSQDEAYASGASKLPWPQSKHNTTTETGAPCAKAVDLFEQIDHKAIFNPIKMAKIREESDLASYRLRWGGSFHSLGDSGHFELEV